MLSTDKDLTLESFTEKVKAVSVLVEWPRFNFHDKPFYRESGPHGWPRGRSHTVYVDQDEVKVEVSGEMMDNGLYTVEEYLSNDYFDATLEDMWYHVQKQICDLFSQDVKEYEQELADWKEYERLRRKYEH